MRNYTQSGLWCITWCQFLSLLLALLLLCFHGLTTQGKEIFHSSDCAFQTVVLFLLCFDKLAAYSVGSCWLLLQQLLEMASVLLMLLQSLEQDWNGFMKSFLVCVRLFALHHSLVAVVSVKNSMYTNGLAMNNFCFFWFMFQVLCARCLTCSMMRTLSQRRVSLNGSAKMDPQMTWLGKEWWKWMWRTSLSGWDPTVRKKTEQVDLRTKLVLPQCR